jgi:hypothetical protein
MRTTHPHWWLAALLFAAAATGGTAAGTPTVPVSISRALPQRLSATGLYSDASRLVVDARARPYSPQYPLWTDGAAKRRWIQLPAGRAIDARRIDFWEFPVGTRFWKEFSFSGRRVETRMLVKTAPGRWGFASYVWNDAQTDATKASAGGVPNAVPIAAGKWHSIPSLDECRACHDSNRTEPLGFTALQLSDDRDPLAVHGEPAADGDLTLRRLIAEGLLRNVAPRHRIVAPAIPATSARERAALGYLSANCGACHNTVGPLTALGLSFRQPAYGGGLHVVARGRALEGAPASAWNSGSGLARHTKWDRPGAPPATTRIVDPDAPELSALLIRMKSRRPASQMPPLGTVVPDHDAVEMMSAWLREELSRSEIADRR